MSLSRSPSPQPSGGWHSPALASSQFDGIASSTSPSPRHYGSDYMNGGTGSSGSNVTWASAQARSANVKHSQSQGFFRHFRRLSSSLPRFSHQSSTHYAEKEKLGRGRLNADNGAVRALYRRTSFLGGGSKFVVILAANLGGGVMEWKGPREWAIERDSVKNKKKYVKRWGYELEIVDMSIKKKYAHEWRESWEKVDTIRNAMRKYPHAEWFWWLDLNTFIMEPTYSLQSHIFDSLASTTYRDINLYNPLNITHPPNTSYLDPISLSPTGDSDPTSINLIVPQDCSGFNLGSFFVRRSVWSDRIMDLWWDPVMYEQKHMEWDHKEQDSLEYLYINQPWVRPHVAFIPQRKVNSFPPGACGDAGDDPKIHYQERDRDFLVNMAGCEWGRDCWGEMYSYRQLSNRLNRSWWQKFKDGVSEMWDGLWKKDEEQVEEDGTSDQEKLW
ncbi:MAG: hypothetical protein Q9165_008397 [Trypethelium subeluteriae]